MKNLDLDYGPIQAYQTGEEQWFEVSATKNVISELENSLDANERMVYYYEFRFEVEGDRLDAEAYVIPFEV